MIVMPEKYIFWHKKWYNYYSVTKRILMKKTTSTLVLAILFSIFFVSCKKEYSCTCDVNMSVPMFGQFSASTTESLGKQTKKNAKAACDEAESELEQELMGYGTASCEIKKM